MTGGVDDLYRDTILDHYERPRNRGRLRGADIAARGTNPLCGDLIELSLTIADDRIADVAFYGEGCSISQASASMMTEGIRGKSLSEVAALLGTFKSMMTDKQEPTIDPDAIGELESLQSVRRYPVRVKCAILPWNVLRDGLATYDASRGGAKDGETSARDR